ncbi:hypothetical protein [Paenibacillus sp. Marseille-Q9583]
MKMRSLLECTIDTANPTVELTTVISAVLAVNPGREIDILRVLDEAIGHALAQAEGDADNGA